MNKYQISLILFLSICWNLSFGIHNEYSINWDTNTYVLHLRRGRKAKANIEINDRIKMDCFRGKEKIRVKGIIESIGSDFFMVNGEKYNVSNVYSLKVNGTSNDRVGPALLVPGALLTVGGVGYLGASLETGYISPIIGPSVFAAGVFMVYSGMHLLIGQKKIGRKWKLLIINKY